VNIKYDTQNPTNLQQDNIKMEIKSGVTIEAVSRWIATVNCSNTKCVNRDKGKVHPRTGHEAPEGE
jgi:hypothetical protein